MAPNDSSAAAALPLSLSICLLVVGPKEKKNESEAVLFFIRTIELEKVETKARVIGSIIAAVF